MNDFHDYLLEQKIEFTEAEFTKDYDWVRRVLQAEMYKTAFSVDESREYEIETDPEVEQAIDAMPKAQALLDREEDHRSSGCKRSPCSPGENYCPDRRSRCRRPILSPDRA